MYGMSDDLIDAGKNSMQEPNPALEYLRKREWSMGHGQCPDCCGKTDNADICDWPYEDEKIRDMCAEMDGTPDRPVRYRKLGHKDGCPLKAALDVWTQPH